MFRYIFFDLDGTITKSEEGIFNAIEYSVAKMGLKKPERAALRPFIGPPLLYSFTKFFNLSEEEGERAVAFYREYYSRKGLYECEVYAGVRETLYALKGMGKTLALATAKPEVFSEKVLAFHNLSDVFDKIIAADMSAASSEKSTIVARALSAFAAEAEDALMVGDRSFDIIGAHANGVKGCGVLYGYGSSEELKAVNADYIVSSPKEIPEIAGREA